MHIKVALTEEIINKSLSLHYRKYPKAKRKKLELFVIPVMFIGLAGWLIYTESKQATPGNNYYMALLYVAFALLYFYSARKKMYNAGKKVLKTLGEYATFELEANEAELITTTPTDVITSYWTDFTTALISDEIVLLYQVNNSFTMFHESFFVNNSFKNFKDLVELKVQPVIRA